MRTDSLFRSAVHVKAMGWEAEKLSVRFSATSYVSIMKVMFFRRERPKNPTFEERLNQLRNQGFTVTPLTGGGVRVSRGPCAVDLASREGAVHITDRAGILIGNEI